MSDQGDALCGRQAFTHERQSRLALHPRHGRHPRDIPTRSLQVGDKTGLDWIRAKREDYGDGTRCRLRSIDRLWCCRHNDIDPETGQLTRKSRKALELPIAETPDELDVATFDIAQFAESPNQLPPPIPHPVLGDRTQDPDARNSARSFTIAHGFAPDFWIALAECGAEGFSRPLTSQHVSRLARLVQFVVFVNSMKKIDLRSADLNLLVVFQRLLAERHVGRAAKRLHVTQSAASHALGRL